LKGRSGNPGTESGGCAGHPFLHQHMTLPASYQALTPWLRCNCSWRSRVTAVTTLRARPFYRRAKCTSGWRSCTPGTQSCQLVPLTQISAMCGLAPKASCYQRCACRSRPVRRGQGAQGCCLFALTLFSQVWLCVRWGGVAASCRWQSFVCD
jgi:hypothetical protein